VSTAALPAAPRGHAPALLAGPAWWIVAVLVGAATAIATLQSLQLGCAIVLYVLVVGVHARSRRAGFVALWLAWLLLPFIRRLFGLSEGYVSADPLAALPFVMTATIAAVELWRGPVSSHAWKIMGAAGAGYLIGVPAGLSSPAALAFGLVAYLTAVLAFGLGYHESHRRPTLPGVLMAMIPALCVYGVVQYFFLLPRWDRFWLRTTDLITATAPEKGHIRVWSTLNSPTTFAMVLGLTAIAYLLARRFTPWRAAALGLVVTAIALTYVRSAWVGLAVGLIVVLIVSRGVMAGRVGLVLAIIVIGVPVIAAGTGTGNALVARFNTLGSLGQDTSAQERVATPTAVLPVALRAPIGYGIGIAGEATRLNQTKGGLRATDNGFLALMLQLGPVGTLLVLGAIAAGLRAAWYNARRSARRADLLVIVMLAFLLTLMLANDVLYGITGIIFWYLLGIAVARYETRPKALTA